jgi:hypothetical protein
MIGDALSKIDDRKEVQGNLLGSRLGVPRLL